MTKKACLLLGFLISTSVYAVPKGILLFALVNPTSGSLFNLFESLEHKVGRLSKPDEIIEIIKEVETVDQDSWASRIYDAPFRKLLPRVLEIEEYEKKSDYKGLLSKAKKGYRAWDAFGYEFGNSINRLAFQKLFILSRKEKNIENILSVVLDTELSKKSLIPYGDDDCPNNLNRLTAGKLGMNYLDLMATEDSSKRHLPTVVRNIIGNGFFGNRQISQVDLEEAMSIPELKNVLVSLARKNKLEPSTNNLVENFVSNMNP